MYLRNKNQKIRINPKCAYHERWHIAQDVKEVDISAVLIYFRPEITNTN
jgi:hypothetical protein